ncbi:hypothetical protein LF1_53160 [Rubripirellula obstinata]|uniref:Uncharacterized protein n=1 Tax=Rubripirellula obstinata TaxID=406547 RepID=A0A5B1C8N3_9BACT|nr:hypothetical protein [Rubripirellula obstinata]KAA1257467.1 hypothetical protein LF1_53160 [Rubripirellula obstinata]
MRHNETLFDFADWLTDPPSGGPIQMWLAGGLLSAVVTTYGTSCCIAQRATTLNITTRGFPSLGRGLWLEISGIHAVTFGSVITCIGLFIHFQWFWGNHKRMFPFHEFAKYGAALGVVVSIIAHAFTMIAHT